MLLLLEEDGVPPLTSAAWTAQAASLPFSVILVGQLVWDRRTGVKYTMERPQLLRMGAVVLLASAFTFSFDSLWIWSLSTTTLVRSYLLSNTHGLMLVVVNLIRRVPQSWGEIGGAVIGFLGSAVTLLDSDRDAEDKELMGDFAALGAAASLVCYFFAIAERDRGPGYLNRHARLQYFMFPMLFLAAVWTSVLALAAEGATFNNDPTVGLFGWASKTWWWMGLYLIFGIGLVGELGYTVALRFLPALIVSLVMLLEPILGFLFGVLLDVSDIPGMFTWIGGSILIVGLVIVVVSTSRREAAEEAAVLAAEAAAAAEATTSAQVQFPSINADDHHTDADGKEAAPTERTALLSGGAPPRRSASSLDGTL